MANHIPEDGLTWYRGSIRPYASLWHTLIRLGSLNRLTLSQLPGRANNRQGKPIVRNTWYPLFNETNVLDTQTLALALGESPNSMRWSHLGNIAPWLYRYFTSHLRFCQTCLSQGYHSSLYSLKLLTACPIHAEPFFNGCACGTVIGDKLVATDFKRYAQCPCGATTFIDAECCRSPTLSVESTRPLDDIATWLEELASVIKPRSFKGNTHSLCVSRIGIDLATWCDVFVIRYPKILVRSASQSQSLTVVRGGPFRGASVQSDSEIGHGREQYWGVDSPASCIYRSICRHIRRHGITDESGLEHFYSMRDDFYNELGKLIQDPNFAAAFTEAEWSRHLDQNAKERRWPFRNPCADPYQRFSGRIRLFGEPDWPLRHTIPMNTRTWLEYQWAAHCLLSVFSYYKDRTERLAAGALRFDHIPPPVWSWAARVNPDGSTIFASLKIKTPLFCLRRYKPKSARIRERELLNLQRSQAVQATCKGPCLTWSQREGWGVTTAIAPASFDIKLHALCGSFKERPKFWLFPADGGYVARLAKFALQVAAQSPGDAIAMLRTAFMQYAKMYPVGPQETAGLQSSCVCATAPASS